MKFPEEQMAYDAARKEKIWKKQPNGTIIPYTDSAELNGYGVRVRGQACVIAFDLKGKGIVSLK